MKRFFTLAIALLVSSVAMAGGRPVVAVLDFVNDTGHGGGSGNPAYWFTGRAGADMADMLANELANTDAFRVVERNKLDAVLQEQDLGASGRVSSRSAAKIGKLTGAQYLITGKVSDYSENSSGSGGGISFKGISLGGKRKKSYIAIDLRVIDANTGEIVHSRTVEGTSKSGGMRVGIHRGGVGASVGGGKNTPAGKAIRAALIEASDYLACVMVDQDGCEREYRKKERRRRAKTKSALSLD